MNTPNDIRPLRERSSYQLFVAFGVLIFGVLVFAGIAEFTFSEIVVGWYPGR